MQAPEESESVEPEPGESVKIVSVDTGSEFAGAVCADRAGAASVAADIP